jgi:hypothetical protein
MLRPVIRPRHRSIDRGRSRSEIRFGLPRNAPVVEICDDFLIA